jgi:predicted NBD/HSP70 family sugar kinase
METYLTLDIGGTKIDICLFDTEYNLISRNILRTTDYRIRSMDFLDDIRSIISLNLDTSTSRLGVSWNCYMNKGVIVWSSLLGGLANYPLEDELSKEFNIAVKVDDDIHAMTIAEHRFGKGKGSNYFVMLNIGTGIGGGYYENGVVRGFANMAGIYCYHPIYIEELSGEFAIDDIVSGRGIELIYQRYAGTFKSTKQIFDNHTSDQFASMEISIFVKYLAKHLVDLNFFYNPSLVIINGSVKESANIFLPMVMSSYNSQAERLSRGVLVPNNPRETVVEGKGYIQEITVSDLDYAACLGVI